MPRFPLIASALAIAVALLNELARKRLRATGSLAGPEIELPGGRFAAGDSIVVKRNDPRHGLASGDRGEIVGVEPERGRVTARIDDRVVELDSGFLHDTTQRGDPYARTRLRHHLPRRPGHTVDCAHLPADHGLTRQLGYTTLSRGKPGNRLYLTREPDDPRAEIGPADPPREPIARLITMLSTSAAQEMPVREDWTRGCRRG